jgi:hypothetical protein
MGLCREVSWLVLALWVSFALGSPAHAQEEIDPLALQIHAFVSQGFLITTENNYLARSKSGSFELTEVGINFTKPLAEDLQVGIQLFARDLGRIGNYDAQLDWFYIDYRWANWLGFRAGRVKVPFGLYNEINDIDAARPFVLLPQSIYPTRQRDYLLAQTGVELYGYVDLRAGGAIDYRLYAGTIFLDEDDTEVQPGAPFAIVDLRIPYVVGARVLWETPVTGLRVGGSAQLVMFELDVMFEPQAFMPLQMAGVVPADFTGLVETDLPVFLWIGSIEYAVRDLWLAAEYSRWSATLESSHPALLPEDDVENERMYAMASYRFLPWLQPGIYYGLYFSDTEDRNRRSTRQHDTAITLRFDVTENWLVKLEAHYMHGTASLESSLNDGAPKSELEPNWFVFLTKTTAYF